ncbi:DUF4239 domain-containing protein [Streptomyces sp. NRRL F-2664]|uniref:bestrophin-like domain n=1 Tax=Streptomyces sp. NRRL F-2664 TaxID=1463842 RepID=UPI0009979481|nr:DUF4239 domain-containing protein [Streptomyces sp. NRRL F-2664]
MLITSVFAAISAMSLSVLVVLVARWKARPAEGTLPNEGEKTAARVVTSIFVFSAAFLIVAAQASLSQARQVTHAEASALREAYWSAGWLAPQDKKRVREQLQSYTQSVIDDEWPEMRAGRADPGNWDRLDHLRNSLISIAPSIDTVQQEARRQVETSLRDVYTARRDRLAAADSGLSGPIVALLALGAVGTLLAISVSSLPGTRWVVLLLASALVGFVMNLIFQIEHPFQGDLSIDPSVYREAIARFRQISTA